MIEALIMITKESIAGQIASAKREVDIGEDLEGIRHLRQVDIQPSGPSKELLKIIYDRIKAVCYGFVARYAGNYDTDDVHSIRRQLSLLG